MPGITVIIYPTPVQGEGAGARIADAIRLAGERAECEVLIVCRGGGSIEDLWAFNDEAVARAIRACPLPVVSGVGHETDFTIADFAADLRAPTPTAAAELVSPDGVKLRRDTALLGQQLQRVFQRELEDRMQRVDFLGRGLVHPGEQIRNRMANLEHLATRLGGAWTRGAEERGWRLRAQAQRLRAALPDVAALGERQLDFARRLRIAVRMRLAGAGERLQAVQASLTHLNPERVLERGYSITRTVDGSIVRDAAQLKPGQELELLLARGRAGVEVKKTG
jgi:exodeoxyribonuclease VII large subunit